MKLKDDEYTIGIMKKSFNKSADLINRVIKLFDIKPLYIKFDRIPIYSQESFDKLKYCFENGKSIVELAKEYNTSPYEIRRFLKDFELFNPKIINEYILNDEQIIKLKEWLKKSLSEKLIDAKIKNYGSLENYNKEMTSKVEKSSEEKYKKLYGEDWKKEIYGKRSKEGVYRNFGSEEEYKKKVSMESKLRWENMSDEEKVEMKERMLKGNEVKHGNRWYNNNSKCRATKLERYGDEYYNNSKKATETTLERYGTKNISYKYFYDEIWFDSSWEVQYYEYLKKNNIEFEYHHCRIEMENGRFYEPDFLLIKENQLVEIKNPHMLNDKGELYDFANIGENELYNCKQNCMDENNVLIINDIEPYRQFTDWEMRKLRDESKVLLKKRKKK